MKKTLFTVLVVLTSFQVISQITEVVYTQSKLNSMFTTTNYYKNIEISTYPNQDSSTMVHDLTPFLTMDSLYYNVTITKTALTSLNGLENLKWVEELIINDNDLLTDISDLKGPRILNKLKIFNNRNLLEIGDLSFIGYAKTVWIEANHALGRVDISLDSLDTEGYFGDMSIWIRSNNSVSKVSINDPNLGLGYFDIIGCNLLDSIYVGKSKANFNGFGITDNPKLTTISGFGALNGSGPTFIYGNTVLSNLCFLKEPIKNNQISLLVLHDNAPGANSEAEILATDCSNFNVGINEVNLNSLTLYPNPAHNQVFVEQPQKQTTFQIYDMSGKIVFSGFVELNGRIGLSEISDGMYILQIAEKRSKLVIQ